MNLMLYFLYHYFFFFFFKQKTAYEMLRSLVGSEMCIRDRVSTQSTGRPFPAKMPVSSHSPSKPSTPMFASDLRYYVGAWRRAPFHPEADPQCLSVTDGTTVCIDGFDGEGNLWKLTKLGKGEYVFESGEYPNCFLGPDLRIKKSAQEAARWTAKSYPVFRGGEYDVSAQFCNNYNQILCSSEATRQVAILSEQEADEKDQEGNFVWNCAWECTPDLDLEAEEDHLKSYLEHAEL
eukprot:TRINITY_DN14682_c0_g1_i1.p1 TRINITY_DN14682_c0_g1~~TRINITY_DN14682_c0_g1_i1.p1  ORF type:complete len:235 (-),score=59.02 TRINITY_DN14682_c0_g1_i1:460-1164(-)